jgi:hypothetical protein
MDSDDESTKGTGKLNSREEFPGWKAKMQLIAMRKGDTDGIFADKGANPLVGYQLYPGGVGGNAKRAKWMELSSKLVGTVGCMIGNSALRRVWTEELERIKAQGAGPPDLRPYIFALCMAALENECARASETANQTARNSFKIAVQSYEAKEITPSGGGSGSRGGGKYDSSSAGGFVAYVDRISAAEEKLRLYGVNMTDDEKKQIFFTYFDPHTDNWPTLLTVWKQNSALTFADILQLGITEQQHLDLKTTTGEATGVRAFGTLPGREYDVRYGYYGGVDPPAKRHRPGGGWTYRGKGKGGKGKGGKGNRSKGGKNGKGRGYGAYGGRGGQRGRQVHDVHAVYDGDDLEEDEEDDGYTGKGQIKCWTCGGVGHKSDVCPSAWTNDGEDEGQYGNVVLPGM